MKKIKLGLSHKTVDEKVAQGTAIKTAMTGNANFSTPNPSLATVGTKTTALQAAKVARDNAIEAAKAATEALHAAEADYDATITQLAAYAENITAGDPVKLESGGFELRSNATSVTDLDQVHDLRVVTNGVPGRFEVRWDNVHGAKMYEVQITATPADESSWETAKISAPTRLRIEDLPSGTRQYTRVRAVAKQLTGPWSSTVDKIVP
jgi:hypothetical protein